MNKQTKSFVSGAAILGVIGLICKVIGMLYRIPMTILIGTQGMAYYQTAYPIYVLLLAISSAGLPVAVSKMVSERVALGDYTSAKSVFNTSLRILILIGTITTVAMLALSYPLALAARRPGAVYSFLAISPALLFVSVMSAYRGYFQGLQKMAPTAFSQLIEQLGKLGVGLILANILLPKGIEWAAAGAILGVTVSEFLSLLFVYFLYNARKKRISQELSNSVPCSLPNDRTSIVKNLLILAVPIIIGSCAASLAPVVDTMIVTDALISIGKTQIEADSLFGNLTGVVNPLINMPSVLSLALAMSLVPAISASKAKNDISGLANQATFGFKLSMLIGLPCVVGFYLLSEPIIKLLYSSSLTGEEVAVAGGLLSIMSVAVLFLTIVQPMTGILQGLGKTYIPVINLFIGVAVKVVISFVLIKIPEINIYGAAIGTVACYAVAGILDLIFAIKYSKMKLNPLNTLVKPLIATLAMGIVLILLKPVLFERFSNAVAALICIAIGAIVYLAIAAFSIEKQDLEFLPGGRRLEKFYKVKKS